MFCKDSNKPTEDPWIQDVVKNSRLLSGDDSKLAQFHFAESGPSDEDESAGDLASAAAAGVKRTSSYRKHNGSRSSSGYAAVSTGEK